ncbi:hypothetical protein OHB26_22945 [Nocardia sp. NBC_01503]|uniref:hypothetical protein n=1 Tax=Nocardia sp. NBC_01503 TaxID=2975997 RepID=UPI002E7C3E6A|nr:hypothetical protein [Nocardia sp. NBC_01503]WTL29817.1 hypothetical protein OHB26_22945 [Nocardia sp. NBC_01503]
MGDEVALALAGVASAFVAYPRRQTLERCPHCGPPVRVDEADLYWLALKLGNTVGGRDDVKALLPMLLERLVTAEALDPELVLGKLAQHEWGSWPEAERRAVEDYLDAVWGRLLAEFPSRVGAFTSAREFLRAIAAAHIEPARYLRVWESDTGSAADRHLAKLVIETVYQRRPDAATVAWLRCEPVRERLFRAFERDHAGAWGDDFARAFDLSAML